MDESDLAPVRPDCVADISEIDHPRCFESLDVLCATALHTVSANDIQ